VNRYWPTLINGTRNIDINENGMPLIYTSININTNANVANTLKITAQLKNPTNNTINATIYKYITFNTTIGNEFIDNITLKFEVSKSWIKQNNMTASNVTLYIYDAGWSKANITKYSEDNEYVYYSTTIAKFNSLAIGVPIIITEPVKKDIIPPTPNETISTVKNDTNNVTNSITTMDDQSFFNKFKKIEDVLINARDKALGYVTNLNIPKETKYLIIITLSSILTLLLGVITGVLVYKNTLKHKKRVRQKPKTKDNIIVNKMMTGRIMPYTEEPPINNTPPTVTSPLVIKAGEKPPEVVQAQISDSEYYVRKISELILQCEYAIDNGKIEDAKKYYEEAKTLYFNSDLDYEHKSKVSDKILALRNKLK
jgi:PGF-pre-PGF domain-containing protein